MGYLLRARRHEKSGRLDLYALRDSVEEFLSGEILNGYPVEILEHPGEPELIGQSRRDEKWDTYILEKYSYGPEMDSVLVYEFNKPSLSYFQKSLRDVLHLMEFVPTHMLEMSVEAIAPWYRGHFFDNVDLERRRGMEKAARSLKLGKKILLDMPEVEELLCLFWNLETGYQLVRVSEEHV